MVRFAALLAPVVALPLLGAAPPTRALAGVAPGLWEVSRSASGESPRRLCLSDVAQLAWIAHAGERCSRTILRDDPGDLLVDLNCAGGDFARSGIRVTTPRSVRLETQGIHRGEPFNYLLYARRVGECPRPRQR
jgi:hypothetical protein